MTSFNRSSWTDVTSKTEQVQGEKSWSEEWDLRNPTSDCVISVLPQRWELKPAGARECCGQHCRKRQTVSWTRADVDLPSAIICSLMVTLTRVVSVLLPWRKPGRTMLAVHRTHSLTRNSEAAGILLPGKQTDFTKIDSNILSCWSEPSRDESSWRVCTFVCEHMLKDAVLFILLSDCGGSFVQLHLHGPWGTFFHRLVNVLKPLASWPTHVESLSEATVWQMWTSDFPAIVICRYLSASATLDDISRSEVWVHLRFLSPFSKMYLTGIWFYIWGVLCLFFYRHSDCPSVFLCAGGTWGNLCFFVVFVSL